LLFAETLRSFGYRFAETHFFERATILLKHGSAKTCFVETHFTETSMVGPVPDHYQF
jgi:hypothetical protein